MSGPAPPPPPPPPLPPMSSIASACAVGQSNNHGPNVDKSRLLADICRGTTLRKTTTRERNPLAGPLDPSAQPANAFDNQIQCTKDLLQAELCSTLKRRKNTAPICDPPKYQYPQCVDDVDSSQLPPANGEELKTLRPTVQVMKPSSSLPAKPTTADKATTKMNNNNIQYAAILPKPAIAPPNNKAAANKPLITHGKPNFTLPRNTGKTIRFEMHSHDDTQTKPVLKQVKSFPVIVSKKTSTADPFACGKTIETLPVKSNLTEQAKEVSHSRLVLPPKESKPSQVHTTNITPIAPVSPPPPLPVKVAALSKHYGAKKDEPATEIEPDNSGRKLFISHGKPNFVVPCTSKSKVSMKSPSLSSKQKCENYLEVKIKSLKPQKSVDDSLERKSPCAIDTRGNHLESAIRSLKSYKSIDDCIDENGNGNNELRRALTKLRSVDDSDARQILKTSNWSGRSTPASELSTDSGNSSPPPSAFGRSANGGPQHHSSNAYANFEQKTVVSFSKDLLDAPNRHPESIKVTKTVTTSHHHHTTSVVQQTIFNNVKFTIDDNGQVVHSNY